MRFQPFRWQVVPLLAALLLVPGAWAQDEETAEDRQEEMEQVEEEDDIDREVDERREVVLEPSEWTPRAASAELHDEGIVIHVEAIPIGATESIAELLPEEPIVLVAVTSRHRGDAFRACEFLIDFMEENRARPFFAFYPMALCHDVTDDLDQPVHGLGLFVRLLGLGPGALGLGGGTGEVIVVNELVAIGDQ